MRIMKKLVVAPENYGILKTIYVAFFTNGILTTMIGMLLAVLKQENSLTYAQSGLMLSAHQFGNITAVLIAGFLPFWIGRKQASILMGSGIAIGFLLMILTKNPSYIILSFALTGIGRGTLSNVSNFVASSVAENKAASLNVLHAIFAAGALLSPVIIVVYTKVLGWKWQSATLTLVILGLLVLALFAKSNLSSVREKKDKQSTTGFLKSWVFWNSTGILFFYLCAEASIVGWFVIYFEDIGILPSSIARFTPTLLWLMIMAGRLTCAALSSYIDSNKILLISGVMFMGFFGGMLLSKSAAACIFCLVGLGFSMACIYPTTMSTIKDISAAAAGFCMAIASAGAIIMPSIVGTVADLKGLFGGVSIIMAAVLCMVLLMVVKLLSSKKSFST